MTVSYIVSYTAIYSDNSDSYTESFPTEELAHEFMKKTDEFYFGPDAQKKYHCVSLTMKLTKETLEPLAEEYRSGSYHRLTNLQTDEEVDDIAEVTKRFATSRPE